MKIIPAILPQRYNEIERIIDKVKSSVDTVQIDFVDGNIAPNKTWWFNGKDTEILEEFEREERGMPEWKQINYEFDLMVRNPLDHMDKFICLGPSKIIFHVESFEKEAMLSYFENLPDIIKETVKFGMALGIGTPPEDLLPFIQYISSIQCMGIAAIGFQGQPFDDRVIEQIQKVKSLYPDKIISIDGAVSESNIRALVDAGATELVVGSAIIHAENPGSEIQTLKKLAYRPTHS